MGLIGSASWKKYMSNDAHDALPIKPNILQIPILLPPKFIFLTETYLKLKMSLKVSKIKLLSLFTKK
jgi:hypothetical protein